MADATIPLAIAAPIALGLVSACSVLWAKLWHLEERWSLKLADAEKRCATEIEALRAELVQEVRKWQDLWSREVRARASAGQTTDDEDDTQVRRERARLVDGRVKDERDRILQRYTAEMQSSSPPPPPRPKLKSRG